MERYNLTVKENPFDGCPYVDTYVSDNGEYVKYADARATVEALQQAQELEDGCEMMTHTAGTFQELWRTACDQREAFEQQLTQRTAEFQRHDGELQQICGQALGYPWFKDDQKNFPGATEKDGVCVGEHVGITIAQELADAYRKRTAELEAVNGSIEAARRVNNDLHAELERVRGERDEARDRSYDEMTMAYCQLAHEIALPGTPLPTNTNDSISFGKLREVVESVVAHLTRVRDQYADLRKMVLALPKVEGEITANRVCTIMMHGLYCEEFTKLLQHRQGMEG